MIALSTSPSDPSQLTLGMLLYPGFTLLDLAGSHAALGFHGRTLLLSKTRDPVATDSGVTINPNTLLCECPEPLDVLMIPGGFGTDAVLEDEEIVTAVAHIGRTARYVTSVCSGSLILAKAGLLDGYRATTHWALHDRLANSTAVAVRERVVVDGNRITGGGVTAGIDFGLTLLAELRGEEPAKLTQLMMEYDPAPPFDSGTPEKAGPELTILALQSIGVAMEPIMAAADAA
ncbi:DJ-1/PfpI family protein [Sphingopyxis sp.]|jgi:cyclohexyl-isocyanide hydratase|uniref:DJ-1/PfpI family protein n=1 Tax=Sphingopyxis sp. TaxID=1908224 RepID=UPI002DEB9E73|nr:DJ-1/PfpI family protein [Sphingopyxis sp.]